MTPMATMTTLLQWLWQGTALALGVAAALRWMPGVNATTRYVLWWLTLVATLVLPLASPLFNVLVATVTPPGDVATFTLLPGASQNTSAHVLQPWLALPGAPDWLVACGVGLWISTVVLGSSRLIASVRAVRRLKRESRVVSDSLSQSLPGWQNACASPGMTRGADLRSSSAVSGACALGLGGRPAVVIGDRLLASLEVDALDLIVLHELMHLRRYDDWSRVVQACVLVVTGLHPAVRFISRRIDIEREAACDEAVAVRTGQAERYAASLAAVADLIGGANGPALVPNAIGAGSLLARVQRLLDPRGCRHASLQAPALAVSVLVLAAVTTGAARLNPVVAMGGAAQSQVATASPAELPALGSRVLAGGLLPLRPATTGVARPAPTARGRRISAQKVVAGSSTVAAGSFLESFRPLSESEMRPVPAKPLPLAQTLLAFPGKSVRNRESSGDNGWASAGGSARRAGLAIGSYFSRAGKAVAGQF